MAFDDIKIVCIEQAWSKNNNRKEPFIFFRNPLNKYIKKVSTPHKCLQQYFYVTEKECNKIDDLRNDLRELIDKIEDGLKTYKGESTKKIILKSCNSTKKKEICSIFEELYESDIKFNNLAIKEFDLKYDLEKRIGFIDIETNNSLDTLNADKEIISIAYYDNFAHKYYVFYVDFGNDDSIIEKTEDDGEIVKYMNFNSEKNMLKAFVNFFRENNPDVLVGWNIYQFDFPYIFNRLRRREINVDCNRMSIIDNSRIFPEQVVTCEMDKFDNRFKSKIYGTEILDLQLIYDKVVYYDKPESRSLEACSQHSLGIGKIQTGNEKAGDLWKQKRFKELCDYNRRDVFLLVKLEEKMGLIQYYNNLQQLVPMSLEDTQWNSKLIDNYILQKYKNTCCFPDAKFLGNKESYEGAIVFDTYKKRYKNVGVMDFSAMYTSIYISFNLSPEFVIEGDNILNAHTVAGDVSFNNKETGLIPQILKELLEKRKEMQRERDKYEPNSVEYKAYDEKQGTFKAILNSFYGVMGFDRFRLYDTRLAKSITLIGREMLKFSADVIKSQGYSVVGGDTDSLMFAFGDTMSIDECAKRGKELEDLVNSRMKEFMRKFTILENLIDNCILQINFEYLYDSMVFFGVKKRYCGHAAIYKGTKTSKYKYVGVEVIRSDTPAPIKDILRNVFNMMIDGKGINDVNVYVAQKKKELMKMSVWDIGIPKKISKNFDDYKGNPQHIKAVQFTNAHYGTNYNRGDIAKMVYVKQKNCNKKEFDVTEIVLKDYLSALPSEFEIDWDRYFEKQIFDKIKIFSEVDGIEGVVYNRSIHQRGLDEYV